MVDRRLLLKFFKHPREFRLGANETEKATIIHIKPKLHAACIAKSIVNIQRERCLGRWYISRCCFLFATAKLKFVVGKNVKRKHEIEHVSSMIPVHTFMSNIKYNSK